VSVFFGTQCIHAINAHRMHQPIHKRSASTVTGQMYQVMTQLTSTTKNNWMTSKTAESRLLQHKPSTDKVAEVHREALSGRKYRRIFVQDLSQHLKVISTVFIRKFAGSQLHLTHYTYTRSTMNCNVGHVTVTLTFNSAAQITVHTL